MGRATRQDILNALALPGMTGKALADALDVYESRVSAWKGEKGPRPTVTTDEVARAVAKVTGTADPTVQGNERAYTAALLTTLERDAVAMRDRIAQARVDLGLAFVTPSVPASAVEVRSVMRQAAHGAAGSAKKGRQSRAG